ncbi:conjugative transposon protein TraJ [Parachryseolinea silvisoli]|uniref:conjugative transposon protein TraJ n=1 Tax=Parachryseolinea silvisoli TaxID=2873601 RepID=UPI002265A717|nr:conjugative transposon protein TraJ [Parachryseolinea silvisoli]MCD9015231.1 conjugative transposon protein TraJ [Parachryseolinea silvisoli]
MKPIKKKLVLALALFTPTSMFAQGPAEGIHSIQAIMDDVYSQTMPLCSQLIDVGRGLAAFAAIWYIGSRVWRQIANAEPIDFYPLLRPFVIGIAIAMFPQVIQMMNAVLQPTVRGTELMIENSNKTIEVLLQRKEDAIKKTHLYSIYGHEGEWYEYAYAEGDEDYFDPINTGLTFVLNKAAYNMKNAIKQWMAEVLQVLYEAAALCINTVRIFYLIVLAIIGPIVFGLAVFDGFQNSLIAWFGRYINVFLWLPVANIFSSILGRLQESMIKLDIDQIEQHGDTVFGLYDTAYLIFLIIGIIGYLFVPSIANYIVHAGDNKHVARTTSFAYGAAKSLFSSGSDDKNRERGSGSGSSGVTGGLVPGGTEAHHSGPAARSGSSESHSNGAERSDSANTNWKRDRLSG